MTQGSENMRDSRSIADRLGRITPTVSGVVLPFVANLPPRPITSFLRREALYR